MSCVSISKVSSIISNWRDNETGTQCDMGNCLIKQFTDGYEHEYDVLENNITKRTISEEGTTIVTNEINP